jgi:hypothetical protein
VNLIFEGAIAAGIVTAEMTTSDSARIAARPCLPAASNNGHTDRLENREIAWI